MERDEAAFQAGIESARRDILAGRLEYRWNGHAGHWGHWIVTQLAERFGVQISDGFGSCFTSASETSFNEGYNSVLADLLDRRFGKDALQAVFAEAKLQSEFALGEARHEWLKQHGES